jgi:hypothetical protein
MTLRLALLILLLVNGVLLAANTGVFGPEVSKAWFESEREPDRMRRQIRCCTGRRRTQLGAGVVARWFRTSRIGLASQHRACGSDHRCHR